MRTVVVLPANNRMQENHHECTTKIERPRPAPTWVVRETVDELLPIVSRIIVQSPKSSVVPDQYKISYIMPSIKRRRLNRNMLQKYRPVSNLTFVSKVLDNITSLKRHYWNSDILCAVDLVVVLVMLDLTAAFDIVDLTILLSRLACKFDGPKIGRNVATAMFKMAAKFNIPVS